MKKFISLIVIGTLLVNATSCGAEKVNASNSDIELKTVSMFREKDESTAFYKEMVSNFEKETGVKVTDETADETWTMDEWKKAVITDFQVDNEPDVLFYFTGAEAEQLIELGKIVDVSTIQKEYPEYGKNIKPQVMDTMVEEDGKTYAIPIRGFWEGLFVNKDLFDKYDLELPTDWESFEKAIQTFHNTDIVPLSVSFNEEPHYIIEHLILSYGGVEEHRKDLVPGEKAPESWVGGLDLLTELRDEGAFSDDATTMSNADAIELFNSKKAAMFIDGSWIASSFVDQDNTTVVPFPSHDLNIHENTDIIGGFSYGFYITKKAWDDPKKRDLAVKFVEEMTSDDSIETFATIGGAPASNVDVSDKLSPVQSTGLVMAKNAEHIEMPIDSHLNKFAWEYIVSNIPEIIEGKMTSEEVLDTAANLNN